MPAAWLHLCGVWQCEALRSVQGVLSQAWRASLLCLRKDSTSACTHIVNRPLKAPPKNNATVDPEKISYHVNRVGWHFPNKIVDLAAEWLGIQIGRRRPENGSGFTQGLGRRLRAHVNLSEEDRVRAAMRDLFPNMPEDSLEAIVEHAFAEVCDSIHIGRVTDH